MYLVLVICAVLVTIAFIVDTVFFVLMMIQMRKTGREIENLVVKFQSISPLLNVAFLGSTLFSAVMGKIKGFIKRNREE